MMAGAGGFAGLRCCCVQLQCPPQGKTAGSDPHHCGHMVPEFVRSQ